ncbi:hypothetical protein ACJMK2_001749 [Sinanodonta woodiana]|uniref:CARD domain-containing protein n=1 Tax=Sinanodonta woodiana TaxID=1069815 RepID=A0ABD3XWJ8_SINWO
MYIQEKELLDDVTIRDINEQTTTTDKISHLIDQIKKRGQVTYERFKECLIQARQADLKIMLEEEEENVAAQMKQTHQDPRAPESRRAETSATKKSNKCILM